MNFTKLLIVLMVLAFILYGCTENPYEPEPKYPGYTLVYELPFSVERQDAGDPVPYSDVLAFTKKLTGAWRQADFFNWLKLVTHGIEKENPEGLPYYSNFWHGTIYQKEGNTVTLYHHPDGGSDNGTKVQAVLIASLAGGYKLTESPLMAELLDELCRGISANIMAMVWDDTVPEEDRYIMSRYIINRSYEVDLGGGKTLTVDYDPWRQESWGFFSDTIHIPNNPYWGDIWAKNKRSKDDICGIFRAAAFLPYIMGTLPEEYMEEGISQMFYDVQQFAKDIVDHDYKIRTRDHDGSIYIPSEDFASFTHYGDGECTAQLTVNLLAYGDPMGLDCGNGIVQWYEDFSTVEKLYNLGIIRNFHMASFYLALLNGHYEVAENLFNGLIQRADNDMVKEYDNPDKQLQYEGELAGYLIRYATCGMPLTSEEVKHIHENFEVDIQRWEEFDLWDPFDPSIPDGEHQGEWLKYSPSDHVRFEDMVSFLQMCASPFYNDSLAQVVDCSIIADPNQW